MMLLMGKHLQGRKQGESHPSLPRTVGGGVSCLCQGRRGWGDSREWILILGSCPTLRRRSLSGSPWLPRSITRSRYGTGEFTESMNFIKDLPVSYLHVFSYSERENTKALLLKNTVDKYKRSERSKILRMLSSKLQRNFYLKSLGTTKNVLFEQEDKNGFLFGFTENYIKIKVPFNKILSKTQQEVYITDYNDDLTMNVKLLETCIQQ